MTLILAGENTMTMAFSNQQLIVNNKAATSIEMGIIERYRNGHIITAPLFISPNPSYGTNC